MKTKYIFFLTVFLAFSFSAEAQLLRKLKKKAENAAERTILNKTDELVTKKTEKTIDDATSKKDRSSQGEDNNTSQRQSETSESTNTALNKNTEAKRAFFKEDLVVKMHENGKLNQTQFFDLETIAVRIEDQQLPNPGFADSEGFMYAFNEEEGQYNKSTLVSLQSQGLMMPTMMIEGYKLPPEPFMASFEKQTDLGMTANPFNGIVEFAFIYKPEHFRYEDFKETTQTLRGETFTKFDFLNEPGYEGSYVLFDNQDRLVEIFTKISNNAEMIDGFGSNKEQAGESLFIYEYKSVSVNLPPAKEVRAAGQGLMEMVMNKSVKGGNKGKKDIDEDDYDTSDEKGSVKAMKKTLKNHKVKASDLPDTYNFNWEYQTEMVMESRKKETTELTFLVKEDANYQAMKIQDSQSKDMGEATMLFDSELNTMVMFMDAQGTNYLQMFPIPEPKNTDEKTDFKITELPSKTILGFNCKGLQLEDDRYIMKVFHTKEAPITLTNFLNFSGNKNMKLPEIDPRLIKQFSDGLIMEMHMQDKKKSKNNVSITAKSLIKKSKIINTGDYKPMDLFSGVRQ